VSRRHHNEPKGGVPGRYTIPSKDQSVVPGIVLNTCSICGAANPYAFVERKHRPERCASCGMLLVYTKADHRTLFNTH
jgi:hypothetical protein